MIEELKKTRQIRIEICKSCPDLSKILGGICKKCGCSVITKTWVPNEKCPINKW